MDISNKYITLALVFGASLGACQLDSESRAGSTRDASESGTGSVDPSGPDVSRFEIEIVGEGEVVVNGEPCTTADGICDLEAARGTVLVLEGDFSFVSETGDTSQEGRCFRDFGCHLVLGQGNVRVVAELGEQRDRGADVERRPFGLLPGQPGLIIDNFHHPVSEVTIRAYEEGPPANEMH